MLVDFGLHDMMEEYHVCLENILCMVLTFDGFGEEEK